jgi:hypothetical protein
MNELRDALGALGRTRRIAMSRAVYVAAGDAYERGDGRMYDAWYALLCEIANAHGAEDDALASVQRSTRAAEVRVLVGLEQDLQPRGAWMGE